MGVSPCAAFGTMDTVAPRRRPCVSQGGADGQQPAPNAPAFATRRPTASRTASLAIPVSPGRIFCAWTCSTVEKKRPLAQRYTRRREPEEPGRSGGESWDATATHRPPQPPGPRTRVDADAVARPRLVRQQWQRDRGGLHAAQERHNHCRRHGTGNHGGQEQGVPCARVSPRLHPRSPHRHPAPQRGARNARSGPSPRLPRQGQGVAPLAGQLPWCRSQGLRAPCARQRQARVAEVFSRNT